MQLKGYYMTKNNKTIDSNKKEYEDTNEVTLKELLLNFVLQDHLSEKECLGPTTKIKKGDTKEKIDKILMIN